MLVAPVINVVDIEKLMKIHFLKNFVFVSFQTTVYSVC